MRNRYVAFFVSHNYLHKGQTNNIPPKIYLSTKDQISIWTMGKYWCQEIITMVYYFCLKKN